MKKIYYKSANGNIYYQADDGNFFQKIEGYADKLVGEEGVKFTVEANLHPSNYMYIAIAIAIGMSVGSLITIIMKKVTKTA